MTDAGEGRLGVRAGGWHCRFRPNHRVSPATWLRLQARATWSSLADPRVQPLADGHRFAFVAGCGHTGTTLLAGKLGLHRSVYAIPRETSLFMPTHSLPYARDVAASWLESACQEGKQVVLEKTPKHVHVVSRIRRLLPDARLLVTTRHPLDTCASLYGRYGDLGFAIERWLMDHEAALVTLELPHTMRIRYEDLTRSPGRTLDAVCELLGLERDPTLATRSGSVFDGAATPTATMALRQQQVDQPIHANAAKWRETLDESQADEIRRRTRALATRLGYEADVQ